MTQSRSSSPITFVISEVVKPEAIPAYEAWAKGINQAAQQFEGFLGVDVIRPRDHAYAEYVIIVKFDHYTNFRNWRASATYQHWIEQSQAFLVGRTHQHRPSGMEMWFTLPKNLISPPQPPYYKQVILGTLSVYPLILLNRAVLGPLLHGLPPLLELLISVIVLSMLLTYPVMPWLTRWLSFWLYPTDLRQRESSR